MMATKSAPFSVCLSQRIEALIEVEAMRAGRSKGAIVEALVDEALRMRLFPGIAFRCLDRERRAWVIGTALDVWQIIDAHRDIQSIERMSANGSANERQIHLALGYYEMFGEEIDAAIAENRRPIEQLTNEFPFVVDNRVNQQKTAPNALDLFAKTPR